MTTSRPVGISVISRVALSLDTLLIQVMDSVVMSSVSAEVRCFLAK